MAQEKLSDRPQFSPQQATRLAEDLYGVSSNSINVLPSERDQNFLLESNSDSQASQLLILKVANAGAIESDLILQNEMIRHLHQPKSGQTPCFQFPVIETSLAGDDIAVVEESGKRHLVRLVQFLPGRPLAETRPLTDEHFFKLGQCLGNLTDHLVSFCPTTTQNLGRKDFPWDLSNAANVIARNRPFLSSSEQKLVEPFVEAHAKSVLPVLDALRESLIHNDANDFNVIANVIDHQTDFGLIDFGDVVESKTINELAIAIAYAMLNSRDPIQVAAKMTAGFHHACPLTETEIAVVFPLACTRLVVSLSMSARQSRESDDPYLTISSKPARELLTNLSRQHPRFVEGVIRSECGLEPFSKRKPVIDFLSSHKNLAPVIGEPLSHDKVWTVDLNVGSSLYSADTDIESMRQLENQILETSRQSKRPYGIGRYDEPRQCYLGEQFRTANIAETRTIHLGIDIFAPAGTPVFSPLPGRVHSFKENALPLDYGPTIILEHLTDTAETFYTLYGHLSRDSLNGLKVGKEFAAGEAIARFGSIEENGNWPAHLHFQIMLDMLDLQGDFPGVGDPNRRETWRSLCPDPNRILRIPPDAIEQSEVTRNPGEKIRQIRNQKLGPSLSLSYDRPLHIVRGKGPFLIDSEGRTYLDLVNNVCHVGHSNDLVVQSISEQGARLNTNTRYLHQNLTRLAKRLTETMPPHLQVCYFVNSGSEANDLALRLARNFTGRQSIVCIDNAYHGNLSSLIEISPYKFNSPGGAGKPDTTFVARMPDLFRGEFRIGKSDQSLSADDCRQSYLADLESQFQQADAAQTPAAAMIAESILSCGGQIVHPDGYLRDAFVMAKRFGAVPIADEVQVGMGRVGNAFWGFQLDDALPDIVTIGKPIANGHPMGAVVTTREIADAFNNGMEYFNTFGGNPVSCAACLAVFDEIENRQLQSHAKELGRRIMTQLERLAEVHEIIGDVRGRGLFIGIEFVRPNSDRIPAPSIAKYIVQQLKEHDQILLSTDGPDENVIKIKPPLVIGQADADRFLSALERVLPESAYLPEAC